jgi:predicted secreted protein
MRWYSALALYLLFWSFTLFLVLPWRVRTSEEAGEPLVPGQAESAPARVALGRKLAATTLISGLFFGLFWLNWEAGWISREAFLALFPEPPSSRQAPR